MTQISLESPKQTSGPYFAYHSSRVLRSMPDATNSSYPFHPLLRNDISLSNGGIRPFSLASICSLNNDPLLALHILVSVSGHGKEENTTDKVSWVVLDPVTKYLGLDNLNRSEVYFSWFWSLGRPESRFTVW